MADKSITDLNVVPGSIDDSNTWFAVAQSGAAYKVSGHDFILALTVILDGHGGIKSITGPTTVGLVDTYTITFADDSTTDFEVTNGKGITGISKTGTSGLVDTYTISYNDGSTSTFTVTNGAKGDTGDSWYVWIRYSGSQPTQDSDMGTEPDNWMGIYSGTSSTAPVHYTDYDWFQIKGEKGDKGDPSTIVSQSVTYQEGTSPNVQPSGTWTTTIPVVSQGNYLWTRTIVTFNSGNPVTFFSVARMGLDGTGSVSSVNNQSPDANGNVTVTASDIGTTDSTSVQSEINGVKNTLTQLDDGLAIQKSGDIADEALPYGTFIHLTGNSDQINLPDGLYQVTAINGINNNDSYSTSNLTNQASVNGSLNTIVTMFPKSAQLTIPNTKLSFTISFSNNDRHLIILSGANAETRSALFFVGCNSTGVMSVQTIYLGSDFTLSTAVNNQITITRSSGALAFVDFALNGKVIISYT